MKYRAKCTHCISHLANIYDLKEMYICKDANDTYIEVDTEKEAAIIEALDYYDEQALEHYTTLLNVIRKEETL